MNAIVIVQCICVHMCCFFLPKKCKLCCRRKEPCDYLSNASRFVPSTRCGTIATSVFNMTGSFLLSSVACECVSYRAEKSWHVPFFYFCVLLRFVLLPCFPNQRRVDSPTFFTLRVLRFDSFVFQAPQRPLATVVLPVNQLLLIEMMYRFAGFGIDVLAVFFVMYTWNYCRGGSHTDGQKHM